MFLSQNVSQYCKVLYDKVKSVADFLPIYVKAGDLGLAGMEVNNSFKSATEHVDIPLAIRGMG